VRKRREVSFIILCTANPSFTVRCDMNNVVIDQPGSGNNVEVDTDHVEITSRSTTLNTYNVLNFIDKDINITKSSVRKMLDNASRVYIAESQRIFMAKDCREWLCPT